MPKGVYVGKPLTIKHKENISEAMKGIKFSEKHKENLSKGCKGRSGIYIRTEWHKKRISEGHNGMEFSDKHKENLRKNHKGFLGKYFTVESKQKISEALMGKNNPSWQGGISFEPYSPGFNKQLKEFIRKRDNYTCQFPGCGARQNGKAFCPHHIDYDKKNSNPINLILLCASCNSKVNGNRNYWQKYFQNLMEKGERNEKMFLER